MWEYSPTLTFNLLQFCHPSALREEDLFKKGKNSHNEGPDSRLVDKPPPPPHTPPLTLNLSFFLLSVFDELLFPS